MQHNFRFLAVANGRTNIDIARALFPKDGEKFWVGLDIDAAPALIVKPSRDGVSGGPGGTDIYIKAGCDVIERPAQRHVFEILRIGRHRREIAGALKNSTFG